MPVLLLIGEAISYCIMVVVSFLWRSVFAVFIAGFSFLLKWLTLRGVGVAFFAACVLYSVNFAFDTVANLISSLPGYPSQITAIYEFFMPNNVRYCLQICLYATIAKFLMDTVLNIQKSAASSMYA